MAATVSHLVTRSGTVDIKVRKKPGRKVGWKKPKPAQEEEGVGVPVVEGEVTKVYNSFPSLP